MRTKIQILMLGFAVALASCSNNDVLQSENNDGLVPVSITASLPEGGMTSRANAQGDEEVTRCLVQIIDQTGSYNETMTMTGSETAGFNTTVYLNPEREYKFLFWADRGESHYTVDTSAGNALSNVRLADDDADIAYFGETSGTWSSTGIHCDLTHAVAKITLNTTGMLTTSSQYTVTVTLPENSTGTVFDVDAGSVTGSLQGAYTYTFNTDATYSGTTGSPAEIGFFYALVKSGDTNQLSLQYNGLKQNPAEPIPNVPLQPNYHITLQGDVANAGLIEGNITATIIPGWDQEGSTTVEFPKQDTGSTTTE